MRPRGASPPRRHLGVDFIDSTGLRAILAIKAVCDELGCAFWMTHGSDQAERLFELTRLVERLPFPKSGQTRSRRKSSCGRSAGSATKGPQAAD